MSVAQTAPLRRALASEISERPFSVVFWDGTSVAATTGVAPTVFVRSPRALAHLLRAPGQLGLGRAYVSGELDVDDPDALIELVYSWRPPAISAGARARLALATALAAGPVRPPAPPSVELRQNGLRRHERARDARSVRHHYDVSNEFFSLFLDESMTYSCALFADGVTTLEQAQERKLDLICRKLRLEPGRRVLDVGCGWGSFAIHAARRYGVSVVGITLSPSQAELAQLRVRELGLEDRVEIRVMDYRELSEERFDAVASIGMVEHVGEEQIEAYARAVAGALRPGGLFLNHGIAAVGPGNDVPTEFTDRYVFPDGQLLHLARVMGALDAAGFEALHVEGLREHYVETLRHWARRLDERLDAAVLIAGPERARVWRLYLRGARRNFEAGFASVYQVLCRAGDASQASIPSRRSGEHRDAGASPAAARRS